MLPESRTTYHPYAAAQYLILRRKGSKQTQSELAPTMSSPEATEDGTDAGPALYKDPAAYPWSIDGRNDLAPFLSAVKEGITKAAAELQLSLAASDVTWLNTNHGHYMLFVPPGSQVGRTTLNRPRYMGMTKGQVSSILSAKGYPRIFEPSPRFSSKANNTERNYEHWCMQLWWFLAMIGDYKSMIILLATPPENCPSIAEDSIWAFVRHRWNPPKSPLFYEDNTARPVKDIFGRHMLAEGTVNNLNGIRSTFYSAVQAVHRRCNQNGSYRRACPGCFEVFRARQSDSTTAARCTHHPVPQFYCNQGSPTDAHKLSTLIQSIMKEPKALNYQAKTRQALLPSDLLSIQMKMEANG